ncbi:uncharacterized protein LOC126744658 isoform X1 [Anthonomus grandis grandis]|uniref:uncharacterized protein LOC126744658 isoform X1 n=1 Tax=Anthonomus grandis grandis TaxID=2921223 RepID=UPI002165CAAB|nr:uncharacterized protein LOC126744658 isoform X1 [Anthonomus grandis grandis]
MGLRFLQKNRKMKHFLWTSTAVLCLFTISECRNLVKRDANPSIDPVQSHEHNDLDHYQDKRKVEVVVGVKNAVLGFVFDKINKFIDHKTAWIDQLDKQNIIKNKAHHIEPPSDPVVSLSSILSSAIGSKLEAAAPLLNIVTSKLGSGSGSGSNHGGFNFGALLGGHKK